MTIAAPEQLVDLRTAVEPAHSVEPWVALAYLVSGVLFILALRGLSSPATSRQGNRFGMAVMAMRLAVSAPTAPPMPRPSSTRIQPPAPWGGETNRVVAMASVMPAMPM